MRRHDAHGAGRVLGGHAIHDAAMLFHDHARPFAFFEREEADPIQLGLSAGDHLPQAARRVLPVLASTWVSLFKDTSLVSVIVVGELAYTALQIRSQTFRVLEMLTAMAALYWLLGYPQAKLVDYLHRRMGHIE
jgi:hypothetical protein